MTFTRTRGFTLIELMVVIAIIGILAGIITASLSGAKAASRDAKRISDLNSIKLALSLYYNDNNKYPKTLATMVPNYLPAVPRDPDGTKTYRYACLMTSLTNCAAGSRYHLGAVLENTTNSILSEDAALTQNANGYQAALDSETTPDFFGESPDCSISAAGSDACYDLSGY